MRKQLALLVVVVLVVCGCNKAKDDLVNKGEDPVPQIEERVPEVQPVRTFGPAGKTVQAFLKNWEYKRYKDMWAQTVHSRREEVFVEHMEGTPIRMRNPAVLSEELVGDDWDVVVFVEVTDVTCAFAACVLNLKYPPDPDSGQSSFRLTPNFLEIEKFRPIRQTWRVVNLNDKYLIDLGAGESKINRKDNVMNYVLDSSDIDKFPALPGSEAEKEALAVSVWLAMVSLDLGLSQREIKSAMREAKPMVEMANENLRDLIYKFKELEVEKAKRDRGT